MAELEKRAPTVAKVFEEQESMSKKYTELSTKMSEAAQQNSELRKQLREAGTQRSEVVQHREVLEREVGALRKQIAQLMSTPVQSSNKRRRRGSGNRQQLALPPPAATEGLSSALVLQNASGSELNAKQDLDRKVIELQVQVETLREANRDSALQAKLKDCLSELDQARAQRGQMEEMIKDITCLLYTSPSPRDATLSRMPSSA